MAEPPPGHPSSEPKSSPVFEHATLIWTRVLTRPQPPGLRSTSNYRGWDFSSPQKNFFSQFLCFLSKLKSKINRAGEGGLSLSLMLLILSPSLSILLLLLEISSLKIELRFSNFFDFYWSNLQETFYLIRTGRRMRGGGAAWCGGDRSPEVSSDRPISISGRANDFCLLTCSWLKPMAAD